MERVRGYTERDTGLEFLQVQFHAWQISSQESWRWNSHQCFSLDAFMFSKNGGSWPWSKAGFTRLSPNTALSIDIKKPTIISCSPLCSEGCVRKMLEGWEVGQRNGKVIGRGSLKDRVLQWEGRPHQWDVVMEVKFQPLTVAPPFLQIWVQSKSLGQMLPTSFQWPTNLYALPFQVNEDSLLESHIQCGTPPCLFGEW